MPNILVADDNPVSLRFFADALEQLGAECALANDGLEAVTLAERDRFDLLLLDSRMPGLDGTAAFARIRSGAGPSRNTPALATTADANASVHAALLTAGFTEVIAKPISMEVMRGVLARHLPNLAQAAAPTQAPLQHDRLDDNQALAAAGGDTAIVTALRGLLVAELDALPDELASMATAGDVTGLRDRLHRLDASAGFCGAPELTRAGAKLRAMLDQQSGWPHPAAADFLATCADLRAFLAQAAPKAG